MSFPAIVSNLIVNRGVVTNVPATSPDMYKMHNIVLFGTVGNGLCGVWGKRERGLVGPRRVCGYGTV